ncbi:hypothetical protein [Pseudomonas sp. efr-133-TYG-5]|uniref:hypothetical protein n=1 Tax=Pseudomonas sp. efr-133-TYG-5 TaxID=3040310 RepID=UPI0025543B2C|nr:hypothetical protein [Pseudomonas sp. efr-133-TYG-5]
MRYLQVIAQDRLGTGVADSVQLRFHQGDQMWRTATAREEAQLRSFSKTYLKCAWFNAAGSEARHLRMFSLNPRGDGTPESVRLHFHEGDTIAYKAAVHDLDNDGGFEVILVSDIDNDGRANRTDRSRVTALVKQFLKLGWR